MASSTRNGSASISRSSHALDERIPRLRHLPDSRVVHASSLYTEEEKKTSAAWNDALFRSDTRDSLNVRLDGPEGSRIVWVPIAVATGRGRHSTLLAFTLRHAVSSALCAPLSARDRPS